MWVTQTLSGDAYNVGCEIPIVRSMVCPEEKGPDFDFGASVIKQLIWMEIRFCWQDKNQVGFSNLIL